MVNEIPWQQYHANGEALIGVSGDREYFSKPENIMSASHVWVWKKTQVVQVLVQKRSETKKTWPGYYDISAAGHIDAGEVPVQAAVREAKEEIGLDINPEKLLYLFSSRTLLADNEIDHVFLYEVDDIFEPQTTDGEVESLEWLPVEELIKRISRPEHYHFVDQGKGYFQLLIDHLQKVSV